jgi:hypothetical protein
MWLLYALMAPASACSVFWIPDELPGPRAGPRAVFTTHVGADLIGPDGVVPVTRFVQNVEGEPMELLVPAAPLAPGDYHMSRCWAGAACPTTTIEAGLGDPGVPPRPPEVSVAWFAGVGPNATCKPSMDGNRVRAASDAVAVVVASEPQPSFLAARLVRWAAVLPTRREAWWDFMADTQVYVAALDAEGELSEWVGPIVLTVERPKKR